MTWASLMAQLVKNLPAIQETLARFLGWEDPLEKGKATHPSILGLYDPKNVGHLISGSFAFSKSILYMWGFLVHTLLKSLA